jgi:hypothetical protein
MPFSDITPEERASIAEALNAPPPPSLTAPAEFPTTGMFGSSAKFIQQISKMQQERQRAELQGQAASAINQISPLDPDYDNKVRAVAMQFGADTFSSSPVQHVLSLADRQRTATSRMQEQQQKAMQKGMLDESFKFLRSADENQMEKFVQEFPDAARELAPVLDRRFESLVKARTQLSQLPEHLRDGLVDENQVPIPAKIEERYKEFNEAFQGPLRKVPNLQTRNRLVDLAQKWNSISADKADERNAVAEDITSLLDAPDMVPDTTIKNILGEAEMVRGSKNMQIDAMKRYIEEVKRAKQP